MSFLLVARVLVLAGKMLGISARQIGADYACSLLKDVPECQIDTRAARLALAVYPVVPISLRGTTNREKTARRQGGSVSG